MTTNSFLFFYMGLREQALNFLPMRNKTTQPLRSQADREKIAKYLLQSNVRDYALFMLGIYTGRRVGDLVALNVEDVAMIDKHGKFVIKNRLQLHEQKTGKYTDIIIHPAAKRALGKYLRKRRKDSTWIILLKEPLFLSRKQRVNGEKRITRNAVWRMLRRAGDHCEINYKIGTHTLRKTFGYILYQNGTALEIIQRALNHSDALITLAYIGISNDDLDTAILGI